MINSQVLVALEQINFPCRKAGCKRNLDAFEIKQVRTGRTKYLICVACRRNRTHNKIPNLCILCRENTTKRENNIYCKRCRQDIINERRRVQNACLVCNKICPKRHEDFCCKEHRILAQNAKRYGNTVEKINKKIIKLELQRNYLIKLSDR